MRTASFSRAVAALAAAALVVPASAARGETARLFQDGRWTAVESRTVADLRPFTPAPGVPLGRFGGLASRTLKASGFFRTEEADGRWWLVDPEGHPFLSVGLCGVNPAEFAPGVVEARFGGEAGWAKRTAEFLRAQGFNTLGGWSGWERFRAEDARVPYTVMLRMLQSYQSRRPAGNGEAGEPNGCIPVFDPEFETHCDGIARALAENKDDPWLLGYFSDNELPFQPDALDRYLGLPRTDPGYVEARRWLDRRPGPRRRGKLTERDRAGFLRRVAERYYGVVGAAIRRHDPNHLFLGSRLHGRAIVEPVLRGSGAVDVVSVNYYHAWGADPKQVRRWTAWSGKPFIASEWYARVVGPQAGDPGAVGGAGFRVASERDQGLFYQNFTLDLLAAPGCVGWHWFKYLADSDGTPHGVVDRAGAPREGLLEPMRGVNLQVHPLAAWFAGGR